MDGSSTSAIDKPSIAARWGLGLSIMGVLLPLFCGLVVGSTASGTSYTALGWFIGATFGLIPGTLFALLGAALGIATLVRRGRRGNVGVAAVIVGSLVVLAGLAFLFSTQ